MRNLDNIQQPTIYLDHSDFLYPNMKNDNNKEKHIVVVDKNEKKKPYNVNIKNYNPHV